MMNYEARKCDAGVKRRFLLPLLCALTTLIIVCHVALISQASEELSQTATVGTVSTNVSSTATQRAEKSTQDGKNSVMLPTDSHTPNSTVASKIQDHGRAVKIVPDGSSTVHTIAKKNPDGSISIEYITGKENEAKALVEQLMNTKGELR